MTKRITILALAMAVLFVLAAPVLVFAREEFASELALNRLDGVWAEIKPAADEGINGGLDEQAWLDSLMPLVQASDKVNPGSIGREGDTIYFETTDGIPCVLDYSREQLVKDNQAELIQSETVSYAARNAQSSASQDVLLIAPYYGSDDSFTDQYKNEAQSIATATGGSYTLISGLDATPRAITDALADNGIIFFDSHGQSYAGSSYLCLTASPDTVAPEDRTYEYILTYSDNTCAINGNYLAKYCGTLPNSFFWMAICEGMKTNGMCDPLLEVGAAAVYGYSQSVTFIGDYAMEGVFWYEMKENGACIADAFYTMQEYCELNNVYTPGEACDPYGDAYPILRSGVDPYPANRDTRQSVYCEWVLPVKNAPPVAFFAEGATVIERNTSKELRVFFNNFEPESYVWSASSPLVTISGNGSVVELTGVERGSCVITCEATRGSTTLTAKTAVVVANYYGGELWMQADGFEEGGEYLIVEINNNVPRLLGNTTVSGEDGDYLSLGEGVLSTMNSYLGNGDATQVISTLNSGDPIGNDYIWRANEAQTGSYSLRNLGNRAYLKAWFYADNPAAFNDLTMDSSAAANVYEDALNWRYNAGSLNSYSVLNLHTGSANGQTVFMTGTDAGSILLFKRYYPICGVDWKEPDNCKLTVTVDGVEVSYEGSYPMGAEVTVEVTPDPGYVLTKLTVGGVDIASGGSVMLTSDFDIELRCLMLGDLNSDADISSTDAVVILQQIAGLTALDSEYSLVADVNHDGVINVLDATYLLQYIVHIITEFPEAE